MPSTNMMIINEDLLRPILKKAKKELECFCVNNDFTKGSLKRVPLWRFIMALLSVDDDGSCVRWTYRMPFEFTITDPKKLSVMWGIFNENPRMTYTKLSRAIRYYYRKGIVEKVTERSFTYKFKRSDITRTLLDRIYPGQHGWKNPLYQEPGYVKIHRFLSNNDNIYASTRSSRLDSRLDSTASDLSITLSSSSEDCFFNSTGSSQPISPNDVSFSSSDIPYSQAGSPFENSSSFGSANCSPCPSIMASLKDKIHDYKEEMNRKTLRTGPNHQPPSQDIFWMVNPEHHDCEGEK